MRTDRTNAIGTRDCPDEPTRNVEREEERRNISEWILADGRSFFGGAR
jgi:hypothetical protein